MNRVITLLSSGLAAAVMAGAQSGPAPTRIGIINIQSAIVSTKDGQKAATDIQTKFTPRKTELEQRRSEIDGLQDKLNKGRNTLSEDARQGLVRDIDQKTKALNRASEDAQAEFDQENQRLMNELGGKMLALIDKYAKENGFSVILDISSPQTPVLYASNNIDITKDIIELYDKNAPTMTAAPAPAMAPRPPAPAAPRRPVTPPAAAAPAK